MVWLEAILVGVTASIGAVMFFELLRKLIVKKGRSNTEPEPMPQPEGNFYLEPYQQESRASVGAGTLVVITLLSNSAQTSQVRQPSDLAQASSYNLILNRSKER